MRKLLIISVAVCAWSAGFAQDEPVVQTNNHEIGVDATPLLKQFLFNPGGIAQSPYYLQYRYHFDKWAIRARVGGNFSSDELVIRDSIVSNVSKESLNFRVGVERKVDFAKRWQFFYGIDLSADIDMSFSRTVRISSTVSYPTNEWRTQNFRYGAAPTLGFRFKLNERISLATESSYLVYVQEGLQSRNLAKTEMSGSGTEFSPFTSLFFTFNF